jgi:hypothetical protein
MTTKWPSAPSSKVGLLSSLTPTARAVLPTSLPASLLRELLDEWTYWCNRPQFAPEGDWRCWVFLGGRGAGKTRAGAEWVSDLARSDSAQPYFSTGVRDDLIQRNVLEAYLGYWAGEANPISSFTGKPMIEEVMLWA